MAALSAIGSIIGAIGSIAAAKAENDAAQFEAVQMENKGKEELAASQREADLKRREGTLIESRQQALAAASGAGAGNDAPTIVRLMTQTAGQAEYGANSTLYGGKERRAGLFDSAKGRRMSGKASLIGGVIGGFGQAIGGIGSAFARAS